MRVFIYFNLHRRCLSVKALDGEQKGRVVAHAAAVEIFNPVFKVSEAGRQRVLRERRKNVHAGVVGDLARVFHPDRPLPADFEKEVSNFQRTARAVTYDPYKYASFVVRGSLEPIHTASRALLIGKNVLAA